jgi:sRNA-binding protein
MTQKNGATSGKPDVDALRTEIAQTRADLGETVQALAAKADVKARAKEQVEQTRQKVRAQAAEATQKARGAALTASERMRTAAVQARGSAAQATDQVPAVREQVRRSPVPLTVVLAGMAALVGVILVVRGRRR